MSLSIRGLDLFLINRQRFTQQREHSENEKCRSLCSHYLNNVSDEENSINLIIVLVICRCYFDFNEISSVFFASI